VQTSTSRWGRLLPVMMSSWNLEESHTPLNARKARMARVAAKFLYCALARDLTCPGGRLQELGRSHAISKSPFVLATP
jgi:hypothetical protein